MARGESQKTQEGDWRQAYSERRFGVLLVVLAALLAGPPVLLGFGLSAAWFDGWRGHRPPYPMARRPIAKARTWLATVGWRRHGLIAVTEAPRAG